MKEEVRNKKVAKPVLPENKFKTLLASRRARQLILAVLVVGLAGGLVVKYRLRTQAPKPVPSSQNTLIDKYKSQLGELAKKAENQKDDPKAQRDYAVALYATGNVEKAKQTYLAEKEKNPNDPVLYNNLGNVYRDSKQYDEAIAAYEKAIELAPTQQNSYVNLAHLYLYVLSKADEAIATYQKALAANPESQDLQVLLGNAYEYKGDNEKANETFRQILDQNPNNVAAKAALERLAAKQ